MSRILILFSLLTFTSTFYSDAFAHPPCMVCNHQVTDKQINEHHALQCKNGHRVHEGEDCLEAQIDSLETVWDLDVNGLPCCGQNCQEEFRFEAVKRLLSATALRKLNERISKEKSDLLNPEVVKRLAMGIDESFVQCCPNCGGGLDKIEGCNAATCSDKECKATFCYLCGEKQEANGQETASRVAHRHIEEIHSGAGQFWERRDGHTGLVPGPDERYTEYNEYEVEGIHPTQGKIKVKKQIPYTYVDRYGWLEARMELHHLFRLKVHPVNMGAVLNEKKAMLQERKMWPIPAGKMTAAWINEVLNSPDLSKRDKVVLLQNEGIFRRKIKDNRNVALIDVALRQVDSNAKILASLDVKDAQGLGSVLVARAGAAPVVAQLPPQGAAVAQAGGVIRPVEPEELRAELFGGNAENIRRFAGLGNMYHIRGLILSGVAPNPPGRFGRNWQEAIDYCRAMGAELPSADEWGMISQAMTGPDGRYDANRLPDINARWFWSSSPHGLYNVWGFSGYIGEVTSGLRIDDFNVSVRCAVRGG